MSITTPYSLLTVASFGLVQMLYNPVSIIVFLKGNYLKLSYFLSAHKKQGMSLCLCYCNLLQTGCTVVFTIGQGYRPIRVTQIECRETRVHRREEEEEEKGLIHRHLFDIFSYLSQFRVFFVFFFFLCL